MKLHLVASALICTIITFGITSRLQACKDKPGQTSSCVNVSEKFKPKAKLKSQDMQSLRLTASDSSAQISERYPSQNDPEYYHSCFDKVSYSKYRCE